MLRKPVLSGGIRSRDSSQARSQKQIKLDTESEATSGRPIEYTFKRRDFSKTSLKGNLSSSFLLKPSLGVVKVMDLSEGSLNAAQNEPEIIMSGFQSPILNEVIIENQLLKNQVAELQSVIVNMCVKQQK